MSLKHYQIQKETNLRDQNQTIKIQGAKIKQLKNLKDQNQT